MEGFQGFRVADSRKRPVFEEELDTEMFLQRKRISQRHNDVEDDYFNQDDHDEQQKGLGDSHGGGSVGEDEEDPLDAFMAQMEASENKKNSERQRKQEEKWVSCSSCSLNTFYWSN
jgi:hypothetical protein